MFFVVVVVVVCFMVGICVGLHFFKQVELINWQLNACLRELCGNYRNMFTASKHHHLSRTYIQQKACGRDNTVTGSPAAILHHQVLIKLHLTTTVYQHPIQGQRHNV